MSWDELLGHHILCTKNRIVFYAERNPFKRSKKCGNNCSKFYEIKIEVLRQSRLMPLIL